MALSRLVSRTVKVARRDFISDMAAAVPALLLALGLLLTGIEPASANACAASCRAQHNQCRIQTKGSPACDARLQACLQGCLKK